MAAVAGSGYTGWLDKTISRVFYSSNMLFWIGKTNTVLKFINKDYYPEETALRKCTEENQS
jgi:hypothetical protein